MFPKDPDLGDFLRSSAAVAAGLQLQHAFEAEHTKKECEEMIEQYAAMGGDGGLTEATMREACCLPPKDYRLAATRTAESSSWAPSRKISPMTTAGRACFPSCLVVRW